MRKYQVFFHCFKEKENVKQKVALPSDHISNSIFVKKKNFIFNFRTTWDEHIIEITLPKPVSLGHIDLRFTLYQQCPNPPAIQITLLKQNTTGFGYRMKTPCSSGSGACNASSTSAAASDSSREKNDDFKADFGEFKGELLAGWHDFVKKKIFFTLIVRNNLRK